MLKITLLDTVLEMLVKMSEGNPGAYKALDQLFQEAPNIDPQDMAGVGMIMHLDSISIYGAEVYILWNDVCQRDARKFRLLLRASQLGLVDYDTMVDLAEGNGVVDWDAIDEGVCSVITGFLKKA